MSVKVEALELLDLNDYPHIHAADVAEVQHLGDGRSRLILIDYFCTGGVWRRQVVGTVTRPYKSFCAACLKHVRQVPALQTHFFCDVALPN